MKPILSFHIGWGWTSWKGMYVILFLLAPYSQQCVSNYLFIYTPASTQHWYTEQNCSPFGVRSKCVYYKHYCTAGIVGQIDCTVDMQPHICTQVILLEFQPCSAQISCWLLIHQLECACIPTVLNHSPITISTPTASATTYSDILEYGQNCQAGVSSHIAMPSRMQ